MLTHLLTSVSSPLGICCRHIRVRGLRLNEVLRMHRDQEELARLSFSEDQTTDVSVPQTTETRGWIDFCALEMRHILQSHADID